MDPSGRTVVPAIHTVSSDEFGVEAANHRADAVEVGARRASCEGVPVRCEIVPVVHKLPSHKPGIDPVVLRAELFTLEVEAIRSGVNPVNSVDVPHSSEIVSVVHKVCLDANGRELGVLSLLVWSPPETFCPGTIWPGQCGPAEPRLSLISGPYHQFAHCCRLRALVWKLPPSPSGAVHSRLRSHAGWRQHM